MEQQKKFEMARDQAINKVNNLKNQIQKMEQLNSNADGKLKVLNSDPLRPVDRISSFQISFFF